MAKLTVEELKRRHEIIKETTKKFRKEFNTASTMTAIKVGENELFDGDTYYEFMNTLSDDDFAANYLGALYVDEVIESYEEALKSGNYDGILEPFGVFGITKEDFEKELKRRSHKEQMEVGRKKFRLLEH